MEKIVENAVLSFIEKYCRDNGLENIWKTPSVKYADARHPDFSGLKAVTTERHVAPDDFLPGARVVISYFLPFKDAVLADNIAGRQAAETWARAYVVTNAMAAGLNEHLAEVVRSLGYRAAVPSDIGTLPDILKSRWSQRHVARLAGHGTFGINNMLITEQGCGGRFFSVVTDLPVEPGEIVREERCLFKRNGTCEVCVGRCVADALTVWGFDRRKCSDMCDENGKIYKGGDVCGKCVVGLPCSGRCP